MVGREPDVGVRFNDNDRDNIEEVGNDTEEQRKDEYVGGGVQQLEDDSDYGGSGDLESQVCCLSTRIATQDDFTFEKSDQGIVI